MIIRYLDPYGKVLQILASIGNPCVAPIDSKTFWEQPT